MVSRSLFNPVSERPNTRQLTKSEEIAFIKRGLVREYLKYIVPTMLTFTLVSIYSIVDGVFVGHAVGDAGLAGVNVAYPLVQLMTAVATGVGMGGGVIASINERSEGVVFMLWGSAARQKCARVNRSRHLVLEAPHPSPLSASRGFFGCHHFSMANAWLQEHGKTAINWQLPLYVNSIDEL